MPDIQLFLIAYTQQVPSAHKTNVKNDLIAVLYC